MSLQTIHHSKRKETGHFSHYEYKFWNLVFQGFHTSYYDQFFSSKSYKILIMVLTTQSELKQLE